MARTLICVCLAAAFSGAVFGQPAGSAPHFLMADIQIGVRQMNSVMRGGFYKGNRYELHNAGMLDLVRTAYGFDPDKVLGGPAWMTKDAFDIVAIAPAGTTPESLKLMLQGLLAERFALVVHRDVKPVQAYSITAGKAPLLKQAEGSGEAACKIQSNVPDSAAAAPAPGVNIVRATFNGVAVQLNLSEPIPFACRNMTMAAFADGMRTMIGAQAYISNVPVVDQTELKGKWDFDVKWTLRQGMPGAASASPVTASDALDKLGLKLELTKVPFPVIMVDSVNETPTANAPEVTQKLAAKAPEFEVADLKPGMPFPNSGENAGPGRVGFMMQSPGRISMQSQTVKSLIAMAWNLSSPDLVTGGPKSAQTTLYDLSALAAVPEPMPGFPAIGGQFDVDSMRLMLRTLLQERFKLAVHEEAGSVPAYRLVAANPTLKKADPANRPGCSEGPGPGEKDPRAANPVASRLVTCLNISVTEFAAELRNRAGGYLTQSSPPIDATGLTGKYDFTVNFSPVGAAGRGGAGGTAITLFDALETQLGLKLEMGKRPGTVMAIDHCEDNPIDN